VLVVLDTSVLVAAWRSRRGASFEIVSRLGQGQFDVVVSVPLAIEYESAISRSRVPGLGREDAKVFVDYVCSVARRQNVFFLWRPLLRDPNDDMVAEVAVAAEADTIVTHNLRDFAGVEKFRVRVITPGAFLRKIGKVR
jgi:putative PIN family toxin of toxin-antitoxin system